MLSDWNKITKIITLALTMFVLASCTTDTNPNTVIYSDPTDAFLQFEFEDKTCRTPCSLLVERRTRVTVTKEGYKSQIFYIVPGNEDVYVKLKLIAASQEVESTGLPDL